MLVEVVGDKGVPEEGGEEYIEFLADKDQEG